jgi:2-amino-4-hydroxy-6-hydroxymethyldihydropteridine diphosphokinase
MTLAYIAIGSNLASPLEQVNAAVNALAEIPDSRVISVSSFYRTPPLGPQDQPDYLNAAVALETTLPQTRCSITPSASNCSRAARVKLNAGDRARWTSTSCCLAMR